MTSEALIYHNDGWACTYTANARVTPYKDGDVFRKRTIAILENLFFIGKMVNLGDSVDLLIKEGEKAYTATVDGINKKNNTIKLILTNGGDNTNYKTVLNNIKKWQDKY